MIPVAFGAAAAVTLLFALALCRAARAGDCRADRLVRAGTLSIADDAEPAPTCAEIRHAHLSIAIAEAREAVRSGASGQSLYAIETAIWALEYARQIDADHSTREVA